MTRSSTLPESRILHHLKLDLLDFGQPLPLPCEDVIDLFMQVPDFQFGFQIDPKIVFRPQTIFRLLPLLAHHDDRRLDRRQTRQNEIEQNVRIRIEALLLERQRVEGHPDEQLSLIHISEPTRQAEISYA